MTPATLVPPVSTGTVIDIGQLRDDTIAFVAEQLGLDTTTATIGVDKFVETAVRAWQTPGNRTVIHDSEQDAPYDQVVDKVAPHGATSQPGTPHAKLEELVSAQPEIGEDVEVRHEQRRGVCSMRTITTSHRRGRRRGR